MPEPRDLPLSIYAAIRAALAERDRPLSVVLHEHELSVDEWTAHSAGWDRRLSADDDLAAAFADAFVRAQDERKAVPAMSAEGWAQLSAEAASAGLVEALMARGLSPADHARLSRHFARLFARDRAAAERYATAFCAVARKAG